jgi:hypothetical protein
LSCWTFLRIPPVDFCFFKIFNRARYYVTVKKYPQTQQLLSKSNLKIVDNLEKHRKFLAKQH